MFEMFSGVSYLLAVFISVLHEWIQRLRDKIKLYYLFFLQSIMLADTVFFFRSYSRHCPSSFMIAKRLIQVNEYDFSPPFLYLYDDENDNNFRCICVTRLFVSSSSSLILIGDQCSHPYIYTGVQLYLYIYTRICEKMKQTICDLYEKGKE